MAHARFVLTRVLAGRATLRRAAVALDMPADALPTDRVGRRLAVFRAYVGAAVTTVSPLLLRVCATNGVSLDELAMKLRPGMVWDEVICGVRPGDAWLKSVTGGVNVPSAPDAVRDDWALQEWLHSAWPIYGDDLLFRFGVRVLDAGLEVAAFPGGHRLRTHGSEGSITLGMELPDTVMAALPGRALDCLIDHPLTNGAGCVVTEVEETSPRWGTKVRFALEPVPWRMPWARSAEGMGDGAASTSACASASQSSMGQSDARST